MMQYNGKPVFLPNGEPAKAGDVQPGPFELTPAKDGKAYTLTQDANPPAPRCGNCALWAPRTNTKQGDCLAHPPCVVEGGASFWPRTWEHELCNEYQPNRGNRLRPLGLRR